ncbi:MAG: ABC transporter ATP-binding protein, partial [Anaerolineaceae bacterium]|nr:ABC transporter ATP-binding protein [Anaerolineaceae bacterium]
MTSNFSVEVKGLKKSFGNVQAVNGADFHILNGEIFNLLGPNG